MGNKADIHVSTDESKELTWWLSALFESILEKLLHTDVFVPPFLEDATTLPERHSGSGSIYVSSIEKIVVERTHPTTILYATLPHFPIPQRV